MAALPEQVLEEQELQLPTLTSEEILVHLVFSDGGTDEPWEMYSIALFPFALGIPADRVYLTASPAVLPVTTSDLDGMQSQIESRHKYSKRPADDSGYFPPGYHAYFEEVCKNRASGFDEMSTRVPPCAIRVVSGYGFPVTGSVVMRTRKVDGSRQNIPFTDIPGPIPPVLSIFDICGSQWAAAAACGYFAANPNNKLTKRREFVAKSKDPFACVNDDVTWSFRVGSAGDDLDPPDDEMFLSKPFGDAVVCSILAALKDFVDSGGLADTEKKTSLDSLFVQKFSALNPHFLDQGFPEKYKAVPKANLGRLQALLQQVSLALNHTAFQCSLFDRSNQWFLTSSRITSPVVAQFPDVLGPILIDYVVVCLQAWHYNNREKAGHLSHLCAAEKHWARLVSLIGLGLYMTKIRLDWDEEKKILVRSEDGMPIQAWALCCTELPKITHHVTNMIVNGSWDDTESSDDEGSNAEGAVCSTDNVKKRKKGGRWKI